MSTHTFIEVFRDTLSSSNLYTHVEGPTCTLPETQTTNVVVVESVAIPDCDFHTSVSEVFWTEAVIHHCVVKHRVGRPLHHPRPLLAFLAHVKEDGAVAEEAHDDICQFGQI